MEINEYKSIKFPMKEIRGYSEFIVIEMIILRYE